MILENYFLESKLFVMAREEWLMIVEAKQDTVKFENQTTACIITLTFQEDEQADQKVYLDYKQFQELIALVDKIRGI